MNKIKTTILAGSILLAFSGAVSAQTTYPGLNFPKPQIDNMQTGKSVKMEDLMSSKISSSGALNKDEVSEMRKQALVEIASAIGASAGLNSKMQEYKLEVDKKAAELDRLFDFSKMTIDNGVLAPVLTEGLANYAQQSDDQIRISDKIYKIEASAKFVSVYPTWRSYVRFSFPSFERPPESYLPKNDTEKKIWDEAIKNGWKSGEIQASRIFEASFARLERDYMGMIKYKTLLAQGLITPTIIAKQNLGVTGGGREMAINDQVFRITDHSSLNPNQGDWRVEYPVTNQNDGKFK